MTDTNATNGLTVDTGTAGYAKTDIDNAADDFIKQISAEFKASDVDDAEVTTEDIKPEPTEQKNTVGDQTRAPYNTNDAKELAGIERLVAREADLREREAALKRKEEELSSKKPVDKEVEELFGTSVTKALEKLGYDPDQIIRRAIAERMGDKAPEKLRQEIKEADKESQLNKRLNDLESKLAAKERELMMKEYVTQITNGAREHVKGIDKYREYAPTVASVAGTNPDRVHAEIMDEISRDAQIRAQIDPNGAPLSYEDATKRVEARWSELAKVFKPANAASTSTTLNEKPGTFKDPNTKSPISNPTPKPPDRPLAPWLQKTDAEEEGIRAAMAEYRRVEALSKSSRD